ncbi:MAG TPA: copper amine oxidase N-terminal domain-containing protein [Desulfotomaculum sp.]|nr:MAG: hypothetical protein JL56_02410 [Desulfotomaculum sp. BICA1-6]HBX22555.1 copper amine oxidase N-terminal domain-containing protein [Desulfotomaculum sp.]
MLFKTPLFVTIFAICLFLATGLAYAESDHESITSVEITFGLTDTEAKRNSYSGPYVTRGTVKMDYPAKIIAGKTFVPLRFIAESLSFNVEWLPEQAKAVISLEDYVLEIPLDSQQAYVNGIPLPVQYPARIVDGCTYVPLRFIGDTFGAVTKWDASTKQIKITMKKYINSFQDYKFTLPPGYVITGASEQYLYFETPKRGKFEIAGWRWEPTTNEHNFSEYIKSILKDELDSIDAKVTISDEGDSIRYIIENGQVTTISSFKLLERGVYTILGSYPEPNVTADMLMEHSLIANTLTHFRWFTIES